MKKIVLGLVGAATLAVALHQISFTQSGGAPGQVTGAPGEGTCLNCHSNSTPGLNSGPTTLTVSLPVGTTEYVPGQTYAITVRNTGGTGSNNGFKITCLTAGNSAAGTFTAGTGTRTETTGGRRYVTHNTPSSTGVWTFNWTAPTAATGPVTFYCASYNGNSPGASDISTTTLAVNESTVGLRESVLAAKAVKLFPNPAVERVQLEYSLQRSAEVNVKIVNLAGQVVETYALGTIAAGEHSEELTWTKPLPKGTYILSLQAGGEAQSRTLQIQ